jgi:hypothetical protein
MLGYITWDGGFRSHVTFLEMSSSNQLARGHVSWRSIRKRIWGIHFCQEPLDNLGSKSLRTGDQLSDISHNNLGS